MFGGRVCALAATFAVGLGGAGCAGGVLAAWKGQPRSGPVEGGQMLFGTLVNHAGHVLGLRAAKVRVLDGRGRPLPAAAAPLLPPCVLAMRRQLPPARRTY